MCILCSVYVLSKMLKLCGAEGSPSGDWWCCQLFLLGSIIVWSRSRCWAAFCCWRYLRSIRYDAVFIFWLMHPVVGSIRLLFLRWTWFWSSILDTVNRLLLKQHRCSSSGCDLWMLIDCWVSSEFSGVNALCWGPSDLVLEVDFLQVSGLRWDLSDGEHAVARTIWQGSVVGGVRSLFDCFQLLLRSVRFLVSEVDLFAVKIYQTLFLR